MCPNEQNFTDLDFMSVNERSGVSRGLREACGVVGIYTPGQEAATPVFYGLFALQHRGQESAGIATSNGYDISCHKGMGLVSQVFQKETMDELKGHIAVGHTRYSTCGSSKQVNAQPIVIRDNLAVGHNGNLINSSSVLDLLLEQWDYSPTTTSDSELIAELYSRAPGSTWGERSDYCMARLRGAFSLVMMSPTELIAVRDPLGIRPLCLGKLGDGWVVASETVALDIVGAKFVRNIERGETVTIDANGVTSHIYPPARARDSKGAMCSFEYIYFARPDSVLDGRLAYNARKRMGEILYREHPVDADLVIGVPDSATAAATGYANASNISYNEGLMRNRYVGRTFINPGQSLREVSVSMKYNVLGEVVRGKRLIVVDDSIVRGTTTPHIIRMLRNAGAKEIHMRVSSPPIISTCHFGVDMATYKELIAANNSVEEIRQQIGADSIGYLSLEGLREAIGAPSGRGLCNGCFTGRYPIDVQLNMDRLELEKRTAAIGKN